MPVKPKVKYFTVRSGSLGEELQEGFGAMQTEFRDYRRDFSDGEDPSGFSR